MAHAPRSSSSLKRLIREQPSIADIFVHSRYRHYYDDRTIAILEAIGIENTLENVLMSKMVALNKHEIQQLFVGDSAPLATFAAKIKLGYALGIFGRNLRADLNRIRAIRNAFAHAGKPITFTTEEVAAECNKLRSLTRMTRPERSDFPTRTPWPPTEPRKRYIETVGALNVALIHVLYPDIVTKPLPLD